MIQLSPLDLALAALLVCLSAALTHALRLATAGRLLISAGRAFVQLLVVGLLLKLLFEQAGIAWVMAFALVMLAIAGYEIHARQHRAFAGGWGYGIGTVAMFLSSFTVTFLALAVIINPDPWYTPQYAIPLLGMLLGNTMTGIAIALDRLTQSAHDKRGIIEARLSLGQSWRDAISDIRADSMRAGMIPTINAMAAAGVVSLPGMMTGQILAGTPPLEAVKYQIMILFMIAAGTIFGTIGAIWAASRRLFDPRERLRLDRLSIPQERS
ncbi:MAG TPA: iron export ABC transporter permease subunit FetB [Gammaproteobacteria bacterium]